MKSYLISVYFNVDAWTKEEAVACLESMLVVGDPPPWEIAKVEKVGEKGV